MTFYEIVKIKDHWERTNQLTNNDFYYEPLGFCNYKSSKKRLEYLKSNRPENVIVLHFFNIIHQSIFLIHNKIDKKYIPLSGSWYEFEKGDTEIYYFMFDYGIKKDHYGIKKEIVETTGSLLSIIKNSRLKKKNFHKYVNVD